MGRFYQTALIRTKLWANSADDKPMKFFFISPRKQDLTLHANRLKEDNFYEMSDPIF